MEDLELFAAQELQLIISSLPQLTSLELHGLAFTAELLATPHFTVDPYNYFASLRYSRASTSEGGSILTKSFLLSVGSPFPCRVEEHIRQHIYYTDCCMDACSFSSIVDCPSKRGEGEG